MTYWTSSPILQYRLLAFQHLPRHRHQHHLQLQLQKSILPDEACTQRLSPSQIDTYFGDGARDKFRKAFRRISQQACYVRTTDEIIVKGPIPFDSELDESDEREPGLLAPLNSPRHDFLAELARLQLPPDVYSHKRDASQDSTRGSSKGRTPRRWICRIVP